MNETENGEEVDHNISTQNKDEKRRKKRLVVAVAIFSVLLITLIGYVVIRVVGANIDDERYVEEDNLNEEDIEEPPVYSSQNPFLETFDTDSLDIPDSGLNIEINEDSNGFRISSLNIEISGDDVEAHETAGRDCFLPGPDDLCYAGYLTVNINDQDVDLEIFGVKNIVENRVLETSQNTTNFSFNGAEEAFAGILAPEGSSQSVPYFAVSHNNGSGFLVLASPFVDEQPTVDDMVGYAGSLSVGIVGE